MDYIKNEMLEIFWIDIHSNENWLSEEDALKRPKTDCQSIGYFLKKDKEAIYISSTIGKDAERNLLFIPMGCIKEIRKVI